MIQLNSLLIHSCHHQLFCHIFDHLFKTVAQKLLLNQLNVLLTKNTETFADIKKHAVVELLTTSLLSFLFSFECFADDILDKSEDLRISEADKAVNNQLMNVKQDLNQQTVTVFENVVN